MTVTFFGHRDAPIALRAELITVIKRLIEYEDADAFFVGDKGNFDTMSASVLCELKALYPHIRYEVVLSSLRRKNSLPLQKNEHPTLYPEGMEKVPPRFAIVKRNEWMVEHSDVIVAYVKCSYGGAANSVRHAERKNKRIINLG